MRSVLMIILLSAISVNDQGFSEILTGLSKNYVLLKDQMGDSSYYEFFDKTQEEYEGNLRAYNDAIKCFYKSKTDILDFLYSFEKDSSNYSNWIRTANPLSSNLKPIEFLSNSEAALILMHNYLYSDDTTIILVPSYYKRLTYDKIKTFRNRTKHLGKVEMKSKYQELILDEIGSK